MSRRVVGLLGGTGAGKSTAAQWLSDKGCFVIDADAVSRDLSKKGNPGYEAVVSEFGPGVLQENGEIDRRALARIVFSDPDQKSRLEGVLHPLMAEEIERQIHASKAETAVLDCAVLLRPVFRQLVDEIWMITAPEDVREDRIMERDGISKMDAELRLGAQEPEDKMQEAATRTIVNTGSRSDLYAKLEQALGNGHDTRE